MDFTIKTYTLLLKALQSSGYAFQRISDFIRMPKDKTIIFRHDVDRLPDNALGMARLEHGLGIAATYYFRAVPESWDEVIIREISSLGHEIGYHYECLTACDGNLENAFDNFQTNLANLRTLVPVSTICMHGSPKSRWDSKDLWETYDYRKLGIVGEPYLDLDFNEVFYLTDTGRCWNGWKVSVRDKLPQQEAWIRQGLVFRATWDIIRAAEHGDLPSKTMLTVHSQRWHDRPWPWLWELIWQNAKNVVKRWMIKMG
jgi:hypothetical protein